MPISTTLRSSLTAVSRSSSRSFVWLSVRAGGLLQGLDRGPCASLLDQVDRRACERAAGHLGQGQLGLPARLLDRALADGNAAAAATVFGAEHGDEFTATPGGRLVN